MKPEKVREEKKNKAVRILVSAATGTAAASNSRSNLCSRLTVYNIRNRFKQRGNLDRKKLEVPNRYKVDAQDLVNILAYCKVHTCKTLNDIIEGLELPVKKSGLSKFIRANGLRIYRQKSRLFLFEHQRITRFIWGSHHENWTLANWKKVVFTDESNCKNRSNNFKPTTICQKDDIQRMIVQTSQGTISVKFWGYISWNDKKVYRVSDRLTSQELCKILEGTESENGALQRIRDNDPAVTHFQQDNSAIHLYERVIHTIGRQFTCLDWPAYSPDLNPIENIWSILELNVSKRSYQEEVKREDELWRVIEEEFDKIPIEKIRDEIRSMPFRVDLLLDKLGAQLNY